MNRVFLFFNYRDSISRTEIFCFVFIALVLFLFKFISRNYPAFMERRSKLMNSVFLVLVSLLLGIASFLILRSLIKTG